MPTAQEETMTLIARCTVDSAEPRQVTGLEADWFGLLTFSKTFTAGITGRTDDGREGSVTVQHGGLESDPGSWFGHIVPGTGTGGFAGWTGSARIVHDDQGAYFEINLA
jgi:Protein of unknown function (DUF3224)